MLTINYLTGSDIIQPDDLFRETVFRDHDWGPYPDNSHECDFWTRVKFCREYWIGKKLSEYKNTVNRDVSFIRTTATEKQLAGIGIILAYPSAAHRHWCMSKDGVQGNKKDYPSDFTFTFGKFKGQKLSEVAGVGIDHRTRDYLEWVYENVECMTQRHKKILGEWLNND